MLIKQSFLFPPKNADRPLHIWLPEDYHTSGEYYPVMYFFDGHNLFRDEDATYGKSWGMAKFLSQWKKPMILVGIECGHEGQERLSEYLPYPAQGWFGQFEPRGWETMEWILRDVKPYIDITYRTIPFRECTAIGGSSMGGIMALYAGAHFNRWFSKAACISTAMGFCMGPLMEDLNRCSLSPDTRMYFSWGTRESKKNDFLTPDRSSQTYWNHQEVIRLLEQRHVVCKQVCQIDGGHREADWEKLVPEFMHFLWME